MRGKAERSFGATYASDREHFRLIVQDLEAAEPDLNQEADDNGLSVINISGVGQAAIVCEGSEGEDRGGSLTWFADGRRVQLRLLPSESATCDGLGSPEQPLVRQATTMRQASEVKVEAFLGSTGS